MPVTARLSRAFYERLGNDIANELVDWFNSVDATYRTDLRELNELNFARFDARLEQRVTQLEARIDQLAVRFDAKLESLEARVLARMEMRIAEVRGEMFRWMFAGWASIFLLLLGTLFAVLRSR